MGFLGSLEQFGKVLEATASSKPIDRRTAIKLGGLAGLSVAAAACERSYSNSDLLEFRSSDEWKNPNPNWQKKYIVSPADTLTKIASQVYPYFDQNQALYARILQAANNQNDKINATIFPDEELYIPNPGIPTFGFAPGQELILRGEKVNDKDLPTKIENIDYENGTFAYSYNGRQSQPLPLKEGIKIGTSRGLQVAAVLKGINGLVQPRIVFELTKPPKI